MKAPSTSSPFPTALLRRSVWYGAALSVFIEIPLYVLTFVSMPLAALMQLILLFIVTAVLYDLIRRRCYEWKSGGGAVETLYLSSVAWTIVMVLFLAIKT